jgi:hypothetical protein
VTITTRDRDTGIAQGRRNGIDVTASVQTQADGSVQVRFNATGSTGTDPGLIDRITAAYHRRMGRQSSPAG